MRHQILYITSAAHQHTCMSIHATSQTTCHTHIVCCAAACRMLHVPCRMSHVAYRLSHIACRMCTHVASPNAMTNTMVVLLSVVYIGIDTDFIEIMPNTMYPMKERPRGRRRRRLRYRTHSTCNNNTRDETTHGNRETGIMSIQSWTTIPIVVTSACNNPTVAACITSI